MGESVVKMKLLERCKGVFRYAAKWQSPARRICQRSYGKPARLPRRHGRAHRRNDI